MLDFRQIIETAINNHPKDCIFAPNAIENAVAEMEGISQDLPTSDLIDALVIAVERQEIYCPHEGIDRRGK